MQHPQLTGSIDILFMLEKFTVPASGTRLAHLSFHYNLAGRLTHFHSVVMSAGNIPPL